MYSESDLQSAVAAGVISAASVEALRTHVEATRALPTADEENFRLITGFNDIFVSIACLLVIFSAAYIGGEMLPGGLLVAVVSWLMAEVFTCKRRMALPSIILLAAFVLGLGFSASAIAGQFMPPHAVAHTWADAGKTHVWQSLERYPWQISLMSLAAALAGGVGALAHWKRFHVAITIAAATGSLVVLALSGLAAATDQRLESNPVLAPAALFCGLCVFAFAMRWDTSDPQRRTQRADIAFWLHLLAAPLIAHPLFYWMGVLSNDQLTFGAGIGVLCIYVVFACIALLIDRRALLVSALAYVLAALYSLLHDFGSVQTATAITTLLIGSALLSLSVFWVSLRRGLLGLLPRSLLAKLPASA